MAKMTGKEVFEMLAKMTDDQRARCVFPGFWDDEEYNMIASDVANNTDLSDEEYDAAIAIDAEKMSEWMGNAVNRQYEKWGEYAAAVIDDVAFELIEHVKSGK